MSAPSVVLVWGEDPFLVREAALASLGGTPHSEVDAREWQPGATSDLATPSLWGEPRALLVSHAKALPDQALQELAAYLGDPSPEARLVLAAVVAERAKAPAALAKLVKGKGEVREANVARKDLPRWLLQRARDRGLNLAPDGAAALVETLGEQAAELDQAVAQLAGAFPGARVARAEVESQFRGLGEQRVWDLCDRLFGKDLPGAVRSLRSLLESREDPLMILGGIASRLRDLMRVRALPDRMPPAELARAAGLRFEWQARRYRDQARRFSPAELVGIHRRVVEADRVLKSGGTGDVVLPVLVAAVAGGEGSGS
ncbi:MAG: DNA polymerase III subunit delta [Actinobacteria bacterium]|nr:DNA polymerase III subunit delta [Actinomycetota bacterium]